MGPVLQATSKDKQVPKRKRWSLEDENFYVLSSDIVKTVQAPKLIAAGSRFYYVF